MIQVEGGGPVTRDRLAPGVGGDEKEVGKEVER